MERALLEGELTSQQLAICEYEIQGEKLKNAVKNLEKEEGKNTSTAHELESCKQKLIEEEKKLEELEKQEDTKVKTTRPTMGLR